MATKFDLSIILKLIDDVTGPMAKVNKSLSAFQKKTAAVGKAISKVGRTMTKNITLPVAGLSIAAIKSAADLETLTVSFESLAGSTDAAGAIVKDLVEFTAKTPFQLKGVGTTGRILMVSGVAAEDLKGKLKVLGDIAAGANIPLEDMGRIFTKSKAKGKAMTEELLQLSDRGVPIIQVLSDELGVSKDKIFEMASKSKISFEIFEKALKKMTAKGGIFANQMGKQSNTVNGLWSTLKDNITLALAEIGYFLVKELNIKEGMKKLIAWIQEMVRLFRAFVHNNPKLAKMILIFVGIAAALGPILMILGPLVAGFGHLATGLSLIIRLFGAFLKIGVLLAKFLIPFLSSIAKAIALIVVAGGPILWLIMAIAVAALLIWKYWNPIKGFFIDLWDTFKTGAKSAWSAVSDFALNTWKKIKDIFSGMGEMISNAIPDWMKNFSAKIGLTSKVSAAPAAASKMTKTQTEIVLKVKAEDGTSVVLDKVKKRRGTAQVNIATEGFLGRSLPVGGAR